MLDLRTAYLWFALIWLAMSLPAQNPLPFRMGNGFTYLNPDHSPAIQQLWDEAGPFVGNYAVVGQQDHWGVINRAGDFILPPRYDEIQLGSQWQVRSGQYWQLFNNYAERFGQGSYLSIQEMEGGLFRIESTNGYGLMDSAGYVLFPPTFEFLNHHYNQQGQFTDLILLRTDTGLGLANWCGEVLLEPHYQRIGLFQEGCAVVMRNFKFGLIDLEGREILPCTYENIYPPSGGLVPVKLANRWGFFDLAGVQQIPFRYQAVNQAGFFQGRAAVQLQDEWIMIDRQGTEELLVAQNWVNLGELSEGLVSAAQLNSDQELKYGYVDPEGNSRIPFGYDRAFPFQGGLAVVAQRKAPSNSVIAPLRYGIINRRGKMVLPPQLEYERQARILRDSLVRYGSIAWFEGTRNCRLHKDGRINNCGNRLLEKLILRYEEVKCVQDQPIAVRKNGKWGFCDLQGKLVIPHRYDRVDCFQHGLAKVWRDKSGQDYFYIDQEGKEYLWRSAKNH